MTLLLRCPGVGVSKQVLKKPTSNGLSDKIMQLNQPIHGS